jgi:hypothetical protein
MGIVQPGYGFICEDCVFNMLFGDPTYDRKLDMWDMYLHMICDVTFLGQPKWHYLLEWQSSLALDGTATVISITTQKQYLIRNVQ